MDGMTIVNPTRRRFFGLLAGALALPMVAPIIVPKRSFFSFFLPKRLVGSDAEFDLQKEINALSEHGGGMLRLPCDVYIVGKSIILPDDVSLAFDGKGLISGCHFTGQSKAIKKPMGIFVSEVGDQSGDGLVTGCFFDMKETGRAVIEIVVPSGS